MEEDAKGYGGRVATPPGYSAEPEPSSSASLGPSGEYPSRGRVLTAKRYVRSDIQRRPDMLFVFGDNMTTLGRGGQAKECRGEPNAVGIPTKWYPDMTEASFFCDDDLPKVAFRIKAAFRQLDAHLASGRDVVWPADGIGTGLAQLTQRAPAIAAYIERCRQHLNRDSDTHLKGEDPAEGLRS